MSGVTLYYNKCCLPSIKVLIALYEKGVTFDRCHLDLMNREQHERWFLEINPRGEVPVLKHGEKIIVESSKILAHIDQNFGLENQLFPSDPVFIRDDVEAVLEKIKVIPIFPLTYGAILFHTEHVTEHLRWPYNDENVRNDCRKFFLTMQSALESRSKEVTDMEAGRVLAEKAQHLTSTLNITSDKELYFGILSQVEAILEDIEKKLGSNNHLGPWICGPMFTVADIALSCLLFKLYQIGMDEKFWKGGIRPQVAVYAEMAFQRPSFEKATEWRKHEHEVFHVTGASVGDSQLRSAYWGMVAAVALAGSYILKKWWKK